MAEPVIAELRSLLGAARVATDPAALAARALDTWPLRLVQRTLGRQAPLPLCVLRPENTGQVAATLVCLRRHQVAAVPYGGGSGVAGGAQPPAGSAVIDLGDLDEVLGLDAENLSVTAQAGVVLGKLEAWLKQRGLTGGHYPQSIDLAQLGGLVATRSAGQFSTRYGQIEDLLLGLEVVLPDGEIVRLTPTPRRAAGPDLRQLFLGSEGCLGIITEVTLRAFPQPQERRLQAYALPGLEAGLKVVQTAVQAGWRPAVARVHDATEAARSYPGSTEGDEALLLLLCEGPTGYAAAAAAAIDAIALQRGGRPLGPEPVTRWLEHRNDVQVFHQLISAGVLVDTMEIAAAWTALPGLYNAICQRLRSEIPELLVVSAHCSHAYDQGANLYFTLAAQPARDPAAAETLYWAIWQRVMETTRQGGGSICHHHGIGRLRARWLPEELGSGYALLRRLKAALDSGDLMNPGALLP